MAIFHAHAQVISRGQGRNAVSAAAYRSASLLLENIIDPETGISCTRAWDYSHKNGVVLSAVFAPEDAPSWTFSREELWNYVERFEKRKDAQLAREFDIALPVELTQEQNCVLIEEIVRGCFVKFGMIADVNVHYDNPNNPHAHVMLTLRELARYDDGRMDFGLKQREWNSDVFLSNVRAKIANIMNWHLALYGHIARVSHLSHAMRGIDLTPTMHIGPSSKHMKSLSDRRELNERIVEENYEKIRSNPELVFSKLSINKPVFTKGEIASSLDEALSHNTDYDTLDKEEYSRSFMLSYSSLMNSKELTLVNNEDLKGDTLYALTKRVNLENRYEEKVKLLASSNNHSLGIEGGDISHDLSRDQKDAIHRIITGPDIGVLEGIPGSGKTFVMGLLAKIYKEAGYNVIGSAPSSAASLNLEASTSITSKNTTLLRKEWQEARGKGFNLILPADYHLLPEYSDTKPAFSSKTVLIIDEASMGELANMDYMLSEVIKAKAKVIFVGDNNQYQAVGFQGALNKAIAICGSSNKLSSTKRQIKESHALATKLLSEYKLADAVDIYLKEGAFRIKDNKQDVVSSITHDYITEFIELSKIQKKDDISLSSSSKSIAIVSHTNESVDLLNMEVRKALVLAGSIKGRSYRVRIGSKELELAAGDQIVFKQNDGHLGILNGELGSILSVKPLDDEGRAILKILVHSADGSKKKIEIDTGSAKYLDLTYGYAVTGYTLQGGSADKILVNFEPETASYESFNVMMTRHRNDVSIYASKEELENILYRSFLENSSDARNNINIIMKDDHRDLWQAGFISSISRRANLSFAKDHSYDITKLSEEDKVIKTYLEARSEVISCLKAAEDATRLGKEDDSNSLWLKITKSKDIRDETAKLITQDYDLYRDRVTQLGINYETLLRHSGLSPFGYSIEQKNHTNSIANYAPYHALIKTLQNLRSEENGELNINEEHTKVLKSLLSEIQDHTFELKLEISMLEKNLSDLEEARYTKTYLAKEAKIYIEKLFPAFLSTIYTEPPSEVLAKYHALLESNNNDSYVTSKQISKNPEILGSLKGLGFGTMLKLNDERKDAALNAEVLQERFKKYRDSPAILKSSDKGDDPISISSYEDVHQDLTSKISSLKQSLPSRVESKLIEETTKALNDEGREGISLLAKLISSDNSSRAYNKHELQTKNIDINKDTKSYDVLANSLEQIKKERSISKSPNALFELIKKEQSLLASEHTNLSNNDHDKDNPLLATRIKEAHENAKQGHIQNLEKSFELITKNNLITGSKLANYLRSSANRQNIPEMHDHFVKTYQHAVIKQINHCLDTIYKDGSIEADGKNFHSQKTFLKHVIKTSHHKDFYPTTSIEKAYNKLLKDMAKIENQKIHHIDHGFTKDGMEM